MTAQPLYPFSDLTPAQVQGLVEAARRERAEAVRGLLIALFRGFQHALPWPPRRRETQAWPAKSEPALSFTVYS